MIQLSPSALRIQIIPNIAIASSFLVSSLRSYQGQGPLASLGLCPADASVGGKIKVFNSSLVARCNKQSSRAHANHLVLGQLAWACKLGGIHQLLF